MYLPQNKSVFLNDMIKCVVEIRVICACGLRLDLSSDLAWNILVKKYLKGLVWTILFYINILKDIVPCLKRLISYNNFKKKKRE